MILLVYARPSNTNVLLKEIKSSWNGSVLICQDGLSNPKFRDDWLNTNQICSDYAGHSEISFVCHERNLGIQKNLIFALTAAFERDDSVILLEDDLKLSPLFFPYMKHALDHFSSANEILLVSGRRELSSSENYSWQESIYCPTMGWATWKGKFTKYLEKLENKNTNTSVLDIYIPKHISKREIFYWKRRIAKIARNYEDAWDTLLTLLMWSEKQLCLISPLNLVENVGNDKVAIHNYVQRKSLFSRKFDTCPSYSLTSKARKEDRQFDLELSKVIFGVSYLRFFEPFFLSTKLRHYLRNVYVRVKNSF